jgi:hypothetical protein
LEKESSDPKKLIPNNSYYWAGHYQCALAETYRLLWDTPSNPQFHFKMDQAPILVDKLLDGVATIEK